jgi:hypothetical protein
VAKLLAQDDPLRRGLTGGGLQISVITQSLFRAGKNMFQKYRSLAGLASLTMSAMLFSGSRLTRLPPRNTFIPAPVTLTATESVEVPASSMGVSDVGVYKNNSLWFLVHRAGLAQLLRTGLTGNIKQIIDLGGDRPASVTQLSTSPDGQSAVTRHNNDVELYSTDGSMSKLGTVGRQSLGRAFVDGRLF